MDANNNWKDLDSLREFNDSVSENVICIRQKDVSSTVPLFCPWCKFPLNSSSDVAAYRDNQKCCYLCDITWYRLLGKSHDDNIADWLLDTQKSQDWLDYIEYRNKRQEHTYKAIYSYDNDTR